MAPIPPTPRIRHYKQTYFGLKYRSSDTMSISIKFLKYHMFQVCLRQVLRKVEEFIFYSKYCQTFPDHEKVLNRFIKWHHQTVRKKTGFSRNNMSFSRTTGQDIFIQSCLVAKLYWHPAPHVHVFNFERNTLEYVFNFERNTLEYVFNFERNTLEYVFNFERNTLEYQKTTQECIPVACVLPPPPTETPRDRDTPRRRREAPFPRQRPETPLPRQTPVKT